MTRSVNWLAHVRAERSRGRGMERGLTTGAGLCMGLRVGL